MDDNKKSFEDALSDLLTEYQVDETVDISELVTELELEELKLYAQIDKEITE